MIFLLSLHNMTLHLTLDNDAIKYGSDRNTESQRYIELYRTQVIRTCHPHLQKLKPSHLPSPLTKTQAIPLSSALTILKLSALHPHLKLIFCVINF